MEMARRKMDECWLHEQKYASELIPYFFLVVYVVIV